MEDVTTMLSEIRRAIEDDDFSPTEWEEGFLENVGQVVADGRSLSERQDEVLERIWKKAVGR